MAHQKHPREPAKRRDEDTAFSQEVEPLDDLPGSIYRVPDKFWGFEAVGRVEHPGACVSANTRLQQATLLQGRGAPRQHGAALVLSPTPLNGLKKTTTFALEPRLFPLRRVALLHADRRLGALSPDELTYALHELQRLFPLADEDSP